MAVRDAEIKEYDAPVVALKVARSKALTRAVLWCVPALLLGVVTFSIYRGLNFRPTGVSNRLVDYSIALVCLPIAVAAAVSAFQFLRWLLLGFWPGRTGVYAHEDALVLCLGSFGTRRYDAARLEVRYPFELSTDEEGSGFEAFLPEEEQLANLLPKITHPEAAEPLNQTILRFASGSEAEVARTLRPMLDCWRRGMPSPGEAAGRQGE